MSVPLYEPKDRLSDLKSVPHSKYKLERGNSESRGQNVYRKNSQKRRSPSFRTPPCEREMLKNIRAKRSSLYSSTPELCPPSSDASKFRPSVRQMVRNFEVVRSTLGDDISSTGLHSNVTEIRHRSRSLKHNSSATPSRSSSMRSSCLSSSFDTGFASDSSNVELDCTSDATAITEMQSEVFESSTSLRLLPTTSSSLFSYHQDNPLYGSLPRIRPGMRSRASIKKCFAETSQGQLKRTHSVNSDFYECAKFSNNENSVAITDTCHPSTAASLQEMTVVTSRATVASVMKPTRGFATPIENNFSSVQTGTSEIKGNAPKSSGTFSARWVHLDEV